MSILDNLGAAEYDLGQDELRPHDNRPNRAPGLDIALCSAERAYELAVAIATTINKHGATLGTRGDREMSAKLAPSGAGGHIRTDRSGLVHLEVITGSGGIARRHLIAVADLGEPDSEAAAS